MIKSMTGFGASELKVGAYHHRLEIKTVNSKFLDVKVKTPLDLAWVDMDIQKHVRKKLARGHVEVLLFRGSFGASGSGNLKVNWDLAEQYFKTYRSIREKFGIKQDVSLAMVTNAREVITVSQGDESQDETRAKLFSALDIALDSVLQMRESEGTAMAVDLAGRCNRLKDITANIEKHAPEIVELYKTRLLAKIEKISPGEVDESRLAQEVCYFADRSDITEEVIRLRSHFQQFLKFLESSDPVGRKLDFLVQEMNREANTIGSKSSSSDIAHTVVEVKSELEKLREQIQNVE